MGKKSRPGRTGPSTAAVNTMVSPMRSTADPLASLPIFPVSMENFFPPISRSFFTTFT